MKAFGKDLIFISQIKRDGSGTVKVDSPQRLNRDKFSISCLSLTQKTFIAKGFNSFVVKIKDIEDLKRKNTSEY